MKDGAKLVIFIFQFIILLFSLLFLPFAIAARREKEKKRSDVMGSQSSKLGFQFVPERNRTVYRSHRFLDHLDNGSDRYVLNHMSGDIHGHPVTVFDFHFSRADGPWWWAPSWRTHYYLSIVILTLEKDFPELKLGVEGNGLFSKIAEAFGGGDIDFESHEFSERYDVRCADKKFAYDFCNAQMIDYLLDQPIRPMEVEQNMLAIGFDSLLGVEKIESHLDHLAKIRRLMPDYLFAL